MLGAIIGDTVGSHYEFHNTKDYDFELYANPSSYTDDTVMTMAVASWLLHDKQNSYQGLEDAIELLDGCPVEEFACWTCEKDDDPEGGDFAFLFYGSNGGIGSFETGATVSVRPVAKIKTK